MRYASKKQLDYIVDLLETKVHRYLIDREDLFQGGKSYGLTMRQATALITELKGRPDNKFRQKLPDLIDGPHKYKYASTGCDFYESSAADAITELGNRLKKGISK